MKTKDRDIGPDGLIERVGDECFLVCPVCGFQCTHQLPEYPRPGSNIACAFWCEERHRFGVAFEQHEGTTFVTVERLPDLPTYGTAPENDPLTIMLKRQDLEAEIRRLRDELARLTH